MANIENFNVLIKFISEPNIWLFVLFDYIVWCEFFPILYKTMQKISNSGGWVMFPKWLSGNWMEF